MKKQLFIIGFVTLVTIIFSCKKEDNKLNWIAYTTTNGLANNNVSSIAIDKQGNKWFGTAAGVSKFDGTNWTTYNTSNGLVCDSVNTIAIDAQGSKWFGTENGVSKFDGAN